MMHPLHYDLNIVIFLQAIKALYKFISSHQPDARGGAQCGGDGRQDGDDEMQDFLQEFFFHRYKLFSSIN